MTRVQQDEGIVNGCSFSKKNPVIAALGLVDYSSLGSGCNVRTQDPENFDEEVKSLVSAWRPLLPSVLASFVLFLASFNSCRQIYYCVGQSLNEMPIQGPQSYCQHMIDDVVRLLTKSRTGSLQSYSTHHQVWTDSRVVSSGSTHNHFSAWFLCPKRQ